MKSPEDIHLAILLWVAQGTGHARLCGEVHDASLASGGALHDLPVEDVPADEFNGQAVQILAYTGGKIVQHRNLVALRQKQANQIRTNESRAPGDQDAPGNEGVGVLASLRLAADRRAGQNFPADRSP